MAFSNFDAQAAAHSAAIFASMDAQLAANTAAALAGQNAMKGQERIQRHIAEQQASLEKMRKKTKALEEHVEEMRREHEKKIRLLVREQRKQLRSLDRVMKTIEETNRTQQTEIVSLRDANEELAFVAKKHNQNYRGLGMCLYQMAQLYGKTTRVLAEEIRSLGGRVDPALLVGLDERTIASQITPLLTE